MKGINVGILLGWFVLGSGCSTLAPEKQIGKPIEVDYSVREHSFERSIGHILSAPLVEGNNVVELLNGDQIFSAMLAAIRKAEKSITLETFIWSSGQVSDSFIEAMTERARAGVKVHVLVDATGSSRLSRADRARLREAGVELADYNPFHLFRPFGINHRTHRKLMVVDGRTGFAGGVCLSDDWSGNAEPGHWRDTHFIIEGPMVAQIQGVFMENWLQARSEVLHGDDYFPQLEKLGSMRAQFFRSGPRDAAEHARLSYLLAIGAARTNIRLAHVYFAPSAVVLDALLQARERGVKVEVIVPGKVDNYVVDKASRSRWGKLLKAGVQFYEYQPTLFHCKIMVVDDVWVTAGSVNFDERSFRVNDEANLNVLSPELAGKLIESFEADKAKSRHLTEKNFKQRNWLGRGFEQFFGLFRSQL